MKNLIVGLVQITFWSAIVFATSVVCAVSAVFLYNPA